VDSPADVRIGLKAFPALAHCWPSGGYGVFACWPQTEEAGSIPIGAGDDPRYGGQTGIVTLPPTKPLHCDDHRMAFPLIFPNNLGTGL